MGFVASSLLAHCRVCYNMHTPSLTPVLGIVCVASTQAGLRHPKGPKTLGVHLHPVTSEDGVGGARGIALL